MGFSYLLYDRACFFVYPDDNFFDIFLLKTDKNSRRPVQIAQNSRSVPDALWPPAVTHSKNNFKILRKPIFTYPFIFYFSQYCSILKKNRYRLSLFQQDQAYRSGTVSTHACSESNDFHSFRVRALASKNGSGTAVFM